MKIRYLLLIFACFISNQAMELMQEDDIFAFLAEEEDNSIFAPKYSSENILLFDPLANQPLPLEIPDTDITVDQACSPLMLQTVKQFLESDEEIKTKIITQAAVQVITNVPPHNKRQCSYCLNFYHRDYLAGHIRRKHPDKAPPPKTPSLLSENTNHTITSTNSAVQSTQIPVLEKYPCPHCEKSFKQLSRLRQHEPAHSNERPFKCTFSYCSCSYKRKHDLINHQYMHTRELYCCPSCRTSFAQKRDLIIHRQTCTPTTNLIEEETIMY